MLLKKDQIKRFIKQNQIVIIFITTILELILKE